MVPSPLPWPFLPLLLLSMTAFQAQPSTGHEDMTFCPVEGSDYLDSSSSDQEPREVREFFECPGPDDPPSHTVCCAAKCCSLQVIDSVLRVDIRIAMLISLTIIIVCILTGIILIICCFCSDCPLYDTCQGSYKRREGLPFGDLDSRDTDPLTSIRNNPKYYATSDVKIKVTQADHV